MSFLMGGLLFAQGHLWVLSVSEATTNGDRPIRHAPDGALPLSTVQLKRRAAPTRPLGNSYAELGGTREIAVVVPTFAAAAAVVAGGAPRPRR
jgi:hypothetical protein